jgi:hypothetical protein
MDELEQETALLQAVKWLQYLNGAPGRHVISFPVDPDGQWEYEWEPLDEEPPKGS